MKHYKPARIIFIDITAAQVHIGFSPNTFLFTVPRAGLQGVKGMRNQYIVNKAQKRKENKKENEKFL
jgi:hypothetical protein